MAPLVPDFSRVAVCASMLFTAAAAPFLAAMARVGQAFCRRLAADGGQGVMQRCCRSISGLMCADRSTIGAVPNLLLRVSMFVFPDVFLLPYSLVDPAR